MYDEIIDRLNSIGQFASSSGVQRAEILLRDMNNPEEKLNIIHVAGTNGKGSVCAYIAQILQENGYKTGLFTSPHLVDVRERIRINNEMISKEDFVEAYEYVEEHHSGELAYFDYLFGMAVYYYNRQNVDYVVMETGLGGRLDATNAAADFESYVNEAGIRDAVAFQEESSDSNNHFVPLIINNEARVLKGQGSGANPRTAIGQRADGAILLLVTDGRGASGHLGATASDLISVMQEYGAVNAANLDGGSSSTMVYNGGYEMTSVTFYYQNSSWKLPTAFVVMPK